MRWDFGGVFCCWFLVYFFFFNSEDGDLFFYSCYEAKVFVSISSLLPAIS